MISAAVFYRGAINRPFTPVPGGHGCVNAGTDARIDPFGLVCTPAAVQLQIEPRTQAPHARNMGWGTQPSYFVYNKMLADGNWLRVRAGWRYDRNWRGYIGPSFAWKEKPEPLLYY
jgi:hypothetical protein